MSCNHTGHEWQEREPVVDNAAPNDNVVELVCVRCDAYQVVEAASNTEEGAGDG